MSLYQQFLSSSACRTSLARSFRINLYIIKFLRREMMIKHYTPPCLDKRTQLYCWGSKIKKYFLPLNAGWLKTSPAFMYYTNSHTNIQHWIMKHSHYVHYSQAISGVYVSFMSMSWATWKRLRLIIFLYTAICLKIFYIIHYMQMCRQERVIYKLTRAINQIYLIPIWSKGLDFINWT